MNPRPIQPDGRLHGVVAAIRREDGRWLCIRRSLHVAAPGKVCFPGGAVEVGEDLAAAIVREMREELGVLVKPLRQCWRWEASDRPLTLFGWTAELLDGVLRPEPTEVAEILWLRLVSPSTVFKQARLVGLREGLTSTGKQVAGFIDCPVRGDN